MAEAEVLEILVFMMNFGKKHIERDIMEVIDPTGNGEIVVYQPDETTRLEVRMQADTVWLNRQQIAQLFGRDVKTIGKHINNALKEELSNIPTVANFAIVQEEGARWVTRYIEHYNLDMIISIGYRVKSQKGILFRRWANEILKEYLLKGIAINQRIASLENRVEEKFIKYDQVLYEHSQKIDFFIQSSLPPKQGIFFDGQIYDTSLINQFNILTT